MEIGKNVKNIIGERFGRLVVVEYLGYDPNAETTRWLCLCDCGNKKEINKKGLKDGTLSCGCLSNELASSRWKKFNRYDLDGDFGIGYTEEGLEFYFDIEDYDKIKGYYWNLDKKSHVTTKEYIGKKSRNIYMHKLIFYCPEEREIDHKNRIGYDNRKCNLRIATDSENSANHGKNKRNTSGYIGVTWNKNIEKWISQISWKNQHYHLGSFENIEDAIITRLKAEKLYFGEFAPQRHLFEQYGIT